MSAPEQANSTKCPNVLGELREALKDAPVRIVRSAFGVPYVAMSQVYALRLLDAFAAAHPGLMDLTTAGPQCPAHLVDWFEKTPQMYCLARPSELCPIGEPCPVMASRRKRP